MDDILKNSGSFAKAGFIDAKVGEGWFDLFKEGRGILRITDPSDHVVNFQIGGFEQRKNAGQCRKNRRWVMSRRPSV